MCNWLRHNLPGGCVIPPLADSNRRLLAAAVAPHGRPAARKPPRLPVSRADSARNRAHTFVLRKMGAKDSSPGLPASSLSAVLVWPNPA
jgi:hypothetical protein